MPRRPMSRQDRRTSIISSTPEVTRDRYLSPASHRCGISQPSPSFRPTRARAMAYDVATKKLLGDYTWGDVHHPGLSQTDSEYDGRWLFVNDNANNRVARIDLRDFKTKEILGPIPNSMGNHGSSFVTENTEYILVSTRFLGAPAKRARGRSEGLRQPIQRHGKRNQGRSQRPARCRLAGRFSPRHSIGIWVRPAKARAAAGHFGLPTTRKWRTTNSKPMLRSWIATFVRW